MKNFLHFLIVLVCVACRPTRVQTPGITYDCRIVAGDFDAAEYVSMTPIHSSYLHFMNDVDDGVFFLHRYLGDKNFSRAVLLNQSNDDITVNNLLKNANLEIAREIRQQIYELVTSMEIGNFRQACFDEPSEGSIVVFLVKKNGKTTFKFEAPQHDHTHLNENERSKIRNAFALMNIIDNF